MCHIWPASRDTWLMILQWNPGGNAKTLWCPPWNVGGLDTVYQQSPNNIFTGMYCRLVVVNLVIKIIQKMYSYFLGSQVNLATLAGPPSSRVKGDPLGLWVTDSYLAHVKKTWFHLNNFFVFLFLCLVVQCLRGVLCAWRVREVSLQIIHKGPLGKHNNQGGRLLPRQ